MTNIERECLEDIRRNVLFLSTDRDAKVEEWLLHLRASGAETDALYDDVAAAGNHTGDVLAAAAANKQGWEAQLKYMLNAWRDVERVQDTVDAICFDAACAAESKSEDLTVPTCECANCGQRWAENRLQPINDLDQRIAPDEDVPPGECPACGALCYEIEEKRKPAKKADKGRKA